MFRNLTQAAIRQMSDDLDQLELQGKRELKDPRTHALGTLRLDLTKECRRRLFFIASMVKTPDDR